jgi:hypothetical protein
MMRRDEREHRRREPGLASDDDAELPLAQTLVALHRSERAPRELLEHVQSHLQGLASRTGRAAASRRWDIIMARSAGWPGACGVAVAAVLLLTWQHRQADEARRWSTLRESRSFEHGPTAPAELEATVTGVLVPGSLQWRMYGDDIGMGHCDAHFLVTPAGAPHGAPIRVRSTRCDLPDELLEELRRPFSPLRGLPALSVSARGRWAGEGEFEALGLSLQP